MCWCSSSDWNLKAWNYSTRFPVLCRSSLIIPISIRLEIGETNDLATPSGRCGATFNIWWPWPRGPPVELSQGSKRTKKFNKKHCSEARCYHMQKSNDNTFPSEQMSSMQTIYMEFCKEFPTLSYFYNWDHSKGKGFSSEPETREARREIFCMCWMYRKSTNCRVGTLSWVRSISETKTEQRVNLSMEHSTWKDSWIRLRMLTHQSHVVCYSLQISYPALNAQQHRWEPANQMLWNTWENCIWS